MYKTIIILTLALLTLHSCRKLVCEDFPPSESKPVLNAIIVENKPIQIHLSYSENINGDTISLVQDAQVILKNDNNTTDTLECNEEGIYTSKLLATKENIYHCEATLTDGTIISTSTCLPKPMKIVDYEHIKEAGRDEEGIIHPAIRLTFENNPNQKLYYQVLINMVSSFCESSIDENGEWQRDCIDTYRNPELLNIYDPLIINEGLPILVFSNELIDGDTYTMKINYTTGTSSSTGGVSTTEYYPLVIELRSISYEYYRYTKQLYLYEQGRYPDVVGDVARVYPLYSNINNGYGIFAAYSTCITDTITVE